MKRKPRMLGDPQLFRKLAETCNSKAEMLRGLGYSPRNAGNYRTLEFVAEDLGVKLPDGKAPTNRSRSAASIPLSKMLVNNGRASSSSLKKRLLNEGVLEPVCSAPFCPLPKQSIDPFTGKPAELKLALDHINGNNRDNRLENLRLLCYHCHGMTPTYCNSKRGA